MSPLTVPILIPDIWQQQAIHALQAGKDVVIDAPTGAGKTYVFEQFIESRHFNGSAIYTVPTRALANDKLQEWRKRNWNVGIVTGDIAENTDAPVIVATLETQKFKFLRGVGPSLFVIDEYQMIGDPGRGVNYELAVALTPPDTQLLFMSGSVGNPQAIVDWLHKRGRQVALIQTKNRPVPLDEVDANALPNRIPSSVQGFWPRIIARALKEGMAPLLAFAPRRRASEKLALQLSKMLPEEEPLILTPEQKQLAGDVLAKLLRSRIAFHHSGLSYSQRAGLIEPLAKAGQLRVVVATMGLSSGINFSMRTVLVTDREYRAGDQHYRVRPDELLQMYGRAGRRGIDKKGYIIVAQGKPRLSESRPLELKRTNQVDWPSLIAIMHVAVQNNKDPIKSAQNVANCLFSEQRVPLGFSGFSPDQSVGVPKNQLQTHVQKVVEFQTPDNHWERLRTATPQRLGNALIYDQGKWKEALKCAGTLSAIKAGTLCRIQEGTDFRFGREVPIARFGKTPEEGELILTRWAMRSLQTAHQEKAIHHFHPKKSQWSLEAIESQLIPLLPIFTHGGNFHSWREQSGVLYARVDYARAEALAQVDSSKRILIGAPQRIVRHKVQLPYENKATNQTHKTSTPADAWYALGLIDRKAHPTRRGIIFSFFNQGEGLAIAAALEEPAYAIEDIVYDIANLRAGHRFSEFETASSRLGNICRAAYGNAHFDGYLCQGVPLNYGDGAAEVLASANAFQKKVVLGEELLPGDIERARLEWRSLLNHLSHAPSLEWDRWLELKEAASEVLQTIPSPYLLQDLPPLTLTQSTRHKSFLRFD